MTSSQIQANETPPMSSQDIESLRDENGLIAGKFKTAADMVNSYKELEGKLGAIDQTTQESTEEETQEEESNEINVTNNYFNFFNRHKICPIRMTIIFLLIVIIGILFFLK